jgi:small-conductance mechanosensitive channel
MVVVGLLSWWYGSGFKRHAALTWRRVISTYEYFSIGQLVRTWFAPFRQISAGSVSGSFAVQWHAFTDRTISRFVGGFMRTIMILVGCISIILAIGVGCVALVAWLLVPTLPLIGFAMSLMGWMPW